MITPPKGLRDTLPAEAEKAFALAGRMIRALSERKYRLVITPMLEYIETISASGEPAVDERALKVIEWETGKVMALRTDFTPQIARLAGGLLHSQKPPLRFCYFGQVLKFDLRQSTKKREVLQLGAELIGKAGIEGDAEIISLCSYLLGKAGLKDFVVQLSDVRFMKSVAPGADRRALGRKEWPTMRLSGLSRDALKDNALLEGPPQILDRMSKHVKGAGARSALAHFRRMVRRIEAGNRGVRLHVDLGEVRGLDYYTGVYFQVFHPSGNEAIAAGGRYDRLLSAFDQNAPATGFAIDLGALASVLSGGSR